MKRLSLLAFVLVCQACATIKTTPVALENKNDEGFYYALPKTMLVATFEIEEKISETGKKPYVDYATCFGIEPGKESTTYKVKTVEFSTRSRLDETKLYRMKMSRRFLNKSDFVLEYGANGELTSGDLKNESQIIPMINTVANFAGTIVGIAKQGEEDKNPLPCPEYDEAIKKANDKSKSKVALTPSEKKTISDYKEAEKAYQLIVGYEMMIAKILNNEDASGKEAIEYKLQKATDSKQEILNKFAGKSTVKTYKLELEIDPDALAVKNGGNYTDINLLFVNINGVKILHTSGRSGKSYAFENNGLDESAANGELYTASLAKMWDAVKNQLSTKIKLEADIPEAAFYYRIPVDAQFQLYKTVRKTGVVTANPEKELKVPVPQYGIVAAAPSSLNKINFKLHPGLGSILSMSGGTSSVNFDELNKVPQNAATLAGQLKKEDPQDELIKKLEKEVKIKELQDKLKVIAPAPAE